MKFLLETKDFWKSLNQVKIIGRPDRNVTLEVEDQTLTIKSMGDNIYAETKLSVDGEPGKAVTTFDVLNVLQYLKGDIEFDLNDNGFEVSGSLNGWIPIKNADDVYPTERPEEWVKIDKEIFNILYPIDGKDHELNAVFIKENRLATSNRYAYAGLVNLKGISDEPVSVHPSIFSAVSKKDISSGKEILCIGFEGNRVFLKTDSILCCIPLLYYANETVFEYAFMDVGSDHFVIEKDEALRLTNVIHALSSSELHDGNDGRGSLSLDNGLLKVKAKASARGSGELEPITPIVSNGGFTFGLSTKLFKNAVSNIYTDQVNVSMVKHGDYQVLVLKDGMTTHFMPEDPSARG